MKKKIVSNIIWMIYDIFPMRLAEYLKYRFGILLCVHYTINDDVAFKIHFKRVGEI